MILKDWYENILSVWLTIHAHWISFLFYKGSSFVFMNNISPYIWIFMPFQAVNIIVSTVCVKTMEIVVINNVLTSVPVA